MYYATWKPATDVHCSGKQWLIRMELAGVSLREVQMEVRRHVLTVQGRRRDMLLQQGFICQTLEISYTTFERSFSFPALIDINSINSEYKDGILRITLSTL